VSEKSSIAVIFLLLLCASAFANEDVEGTEPQSKFKYVWNETDQQRDQRLLWWTNARFGMFIHWGVYSIPAHGGEAKNSEWVKLYGRIPEEQYQKYVDTFNPDLYEPGDWAQMAKQAGMKYVVIVAKHHDGFCLWDSKYTDYKVTNTPYGKDLLGPMVDAFRAAGIRVGLYYSLIDWHHSQFPIDRCHPQGWFPIREKDQEKIKQIREANKTRDTRAYAQYMRNQVRELLTQFGQIDLMFMDFSYPGDHGKGRNEWESEKLLTMVRKLQPQIIVNDRLDLMDVPGGWDFKTPEHRVPDKWETYEGKRVPWETCHTFGTSWGYYRDETGWKSSRDVLDILISCVSRGGNLLFNVGPTARGTWDDRTQARLQDIGKWMRLHKQSIYGCTEAPNEFKAPSGCKLTYNPQSKRIYIHVFNWPEEGKLELTGFDRRIYCVRLLNDGSEISFTDDPAVLALPAKPSLVTIPVIEVYLR
jgi:alpha-L-fucosidase